jgi:hypothetical protein
MFKKLWKKILLRNLFLIFMRIPERKSYRYDGQSRYFTEECEGCDFYRAVVVDGVINELCCWGVAFKYLDPTKVFSSCSSLKREQPPGWTSLGYIEQLLADNPDIELFDMWGY